MTKLKNYDASSIPEKVEKEIKKKLASNPDFNPTKMASISSAGKVFCEWIHALSSFTDVNK